MYGYISKFANLMNLDSSMTLYKTHNLPIFEPRIKKSLEYQMEGYNFNCN